MPSLNEKGPSIGICLQCEEMVSNLTYGLCLSCKTKEDERQKRLLMDVSAKLEDLESLRIERIPPRRDGVNQGEAAQ